MLIARTRRLNGQYSYKTPSFNKDCYKYSLYPRTLPEWNLLPEEIRSTPDLNTFKSALDGINMREIVNRAHFKI